MSSLVRSPLNPDWLPPQGWEHILGAKLDYPLGNWALHLWGVQLNEHVETHSRGASRNHLNQILKNQTGATFHQTLLKRRLEIARGLLEQG